VTYVLCHTPNLVKYGSKPARELSKDENVGLTEKLQSALRGFDDAVAYGPNQAYIGAIDPDVLHDVPSPWWKNPIQGACRFTEWGEIMPEIEFLGLLKANDHFHLVHLRSDVAEDVRAALAAHPLHFEHEIEAIEGTEDDEFDQLLADSETLPLHLDGYDGVAGCIVTGHDEDKNLVAHILLENLATKASGALAMNHLVQRQGLNASDVNYVLNCGEEAVGDRYQRGGGSLSKAMAEQVQMVNASGSDTKAFCCAPAHSIVEAAALVQANVFDNVVVVGGGSLAKLGMKFASHISKGMPILEDVLAGVAIHITRDDGVNPRIRLDTVGRHRVGSGSSQQAILQDLVRTPLHGVGLKFTDIDRYATEMHNPEVTEPSGSGNVPERNYKMLASMAAIDGEIDREDLDAFIKERGTPGFSPTQGHIAAAIPLLGHVLRDLKAKRIERSMFLAKGSLFLGKMTNQSDGMSFLLEGPSNEQSR
jgi:glycine/sarcosine/betaine reductase complex component C subunit beta